MTTVHLARDLGHVLDDLLERSTQNATAELAAHNLTLTDLRVLRLLDRRPGGDTVRALAARLGLPAADARGVADLASPPRSRDGLEQGPRRADAPRPRARQRARTRAAQRARGVRR